MYYRRNEYVSEEMEGLRAELSERDKDTDK
jgi:hypothetical protein